MEAKEFIISECKVMNSKKQPLWLTMKSNCEEEEIHLKIHNNPIDD